jgi:PAS domain S-box-containing protein
LISRFETVHVGRDGRRVEVELTFAPIRDSAGRVAGAWCATRDITERKRAERELTRMAAAAEYGTDAVVSIDLDGRVRHWNQGAEPLYGIPEEAAIGSTIVEINALTGQPEEANARARDAIAHVARGDPAYCMEARRRRQNGTIVDVLTTVMPWHVDGRVVGVTTTAVDISERKRVEEANASLAAIVDASDDAIVGKALDSEIKSWNPAAEEIYGYTAAEAVGKNVSLLLAPGHEDELPDCPSCWPASRAESASAISRQSADAKDGRLIEVSLTISPIRDRQKRIVGAATIARDVTERNAREGELARLAQAAEYGTDAVLSIDLDGRVRHWNHGTERTQGRHDHRHPDQRRAVARRWAVGRRDRSHDRHDRAKACGPDRRSARRDRRVDG